MADKWDQFAAPAATADKWDQYAQPAEPQQEKPWIGTAPPKDEGILSSIFHAPAYGVQDIGAGVKHLMTPGKRMQGAHEVISGTGRAAIPFIAPAVAAYGAGPVALGLGGSVIGSTIGKTGASMLGANEDVANLAGDAGAIAGGMGAPRMPFKSMAGKALDFVPETDAGIRDVVGMASPRFARGLGVLQRAKDARAAYQNAQPAPESSANPIVFGDKGAFEKLPPRVQEAVLKGQSHVPAQPAAPAPAAEPRGPEYYGIQAPKPATVDISGGLEKLRGNVGLAPGEGPGEVPGAHYPERFSGSDSPTIRSGVAKAKYLRVNPEELGVHGGIEGTPIKGPLNTPEKIRIAKELALELKKNSKGGQ